MKQKLSLLFIAFISNLLLLKSANSQSPFSIPYQAVARDISGNLMANQNISLRLTLIDSNINLIDYQETHAVTTNALGLFTLHIGEGIPTFGNLASIDWKISGNEHLQVEMDINGGTNYTNMGITKFNSVPFSLHANTSGDNKWNSNGNSIYNNNLGGVGIGTPTPNAKLDVNGMAFFRNNTGGLLDPSAGTGIKLSTENNKGNIFGFDYSTFTPIDLVLQGEGANVGIGNHFPESTLQITKPNDATTLTIGSNSQGGQFTALRLQTSANSGGYSNIQSIKYSGYDFGDLILNRDGGNIGLGTSSPQHKLSVGDSTSDAQAVTIRGYSNSPSFWKGGGAFGYDSSTVIMGQLNNVATIGAHNPNLTSWKDLSINPDGGNVGIGNSTPNAKLDIVGNIKITDGTEGAGKVLTSDANGLASWTTPTNTNIGCVLRARNWTAPANGLGYTSGSFLAPSLIDSTGIYGDSRLVNSGSMNVITSSLANTLLFTAPSTGYYQVSLKILSVASSVRLLIVASLNGATPVEILDQLTSNPCANCSDISHSQVIYLNAGDTHRVLRSSSGTAINDMVISYRKL